VVLRVDTLIEAVVFHATVLAGLLERHRPVCAADRATEGLRSEVDVAQLAEM
jgi:hypothetical protein